MTTSGNNYDHGSLYVEADGTWRVIAPTEPGPQPFNPGGEIVMWTSSDEGITWKMVRQLTRNSPFNHTFARRPFDADPDFYALWADGHGREPSLSSLYFTDQKGTQVWRLPEKDGFGFCGASGGVGFGSKMSSSYCCQIKRRQFVWPLALCGFFASHSVGV